MSAHTRVAVIGAGTMGHGIAYVSALAGCRVCMTDTDPERLERGALQVAAAFEGPQNQVDGALWQPQSTTELRDGEAPARLRKALEQRQRAIEGRDARRTVWTPGAVGHVAPIWTWPGGERNNGKRLLPEKKFFQPSDALPAR